MGRLWGSLRWCGGCWRSWPRREGVGEVALALQQARASCAAVGARSGPRTVGHGGDYLLHHHANNDVREVCTG